MTTATTGAARTKKVRPRLGYLAPSSMHGHGYMPPNRASEKRGAGRLLFHAIGCKVDGGPGVPHGVCLKCGDDVINQFYKTLMRVDRRAG